MSNLFIPCLLGKVGLETDLFDVISENNEGAFWLRQLRQKLFEIK